MSHDTLKDIFFIVKRLRLTSTMSRCPSQSSPKSSLIEHKIKKPQQKLPLPGVFPDNKLAVLYHKRSRNILVKFESTFGSYTSGLFSPCPKITEKRLQLKSLAKRMRPQDCVGFLFTLTPATQVFYIHKMGNLTVAAIPFIGNCNGWIFFCLLFPALTVPNRSLLIRESISRGQEMQVFSYVSERKADYQVCSTMLPKITWSHVLEALAARLCTCLSFPCYLQCTSHCLKNKPTKWKKKNNLKESTPKNTTNKTISKPFCSHHHPHVIFILFYRLISFRNTMPSNFPFTELSLEQPWKWCSSTDVIRHENSYNS